MLPDTLETHNLYFLLSHKIILTCILQKITKRVHSQCVLELLIKSYKEYFLIKPLNKTNQWN